MSDVAIREDMVLDALRVVMDPDLNRDIVSLNFIRNLKIEGTTVSFDVNLTTPACPVKDRLREQSKQAVLSKVPGVKNVLVNMTSAGSGARVGLLDADIYGPSIPILMRAGQPAEPRADNVIEPGLAHGVKLMSMGYMSPGDQPLIWRGPMAHKALQQCLLGVNWGELDYLVVDLPPGTGDVHLTLVQTASVTGAVIVSTPQDVGLQISMKTLRMFQQTKVHLLGIVENMSTYVCPHCGARDDLFGHGGAKRAAESLGVPFLGEIPLDAAIRRYSDEGTPVVLSEPESPSGKAFQEIAGKLAQQVSIQTFKRIALTVVEE